MYFSSENSSTAGFARWLDARLPSCNDNDDPDHDSTVVAADPDGDGTASALPPERPYSPWLVPGVGISI